MDDGKSFLKLKDGTRLLPYEPDCRLGSSKLPEQENIRCYTTNLQMATMALLVELRVLGDLVRSSSTDRAICMA